MQEREASVAASSNAAALARVIVWVAAMVAVVTTWILGVGDKEKCSEAFAITRFDGRTLTICNWVGLFQATQFVATLTVLVLSLRDIRRHGKLQRVPLYLVLFVLAVGCYVVPSISLGFR